MVVSLSLERTEEKCRERVFGFGGTCGALLLRPSLSNDAVNELIRKGQAVPDLTPICLNPMSGCALKAAPRVVALSRLLTP